MSDINLIIITTMVLMKTMRTKFQRRLLPDLLAEKAVSLQLGAYLLPNTTLESLSLIGVNMSSNYPFAQLSTMLDIL